PTAAPTATPTPAPVAAATSTPILAAPEPEPTPAPLSIAPATPMSDLQATLSAIYARNSAEGNYAFAVTDLQTGETVGINLTQAHYTGCTVSFFALLQGTIDVQDGRLEEPRVGELISKIVWSSSAYGARQLYGVLGTIAPERIWTNEQFDEDGSDIVSGVGRVATLIDALELDDTILDHPPAYGSESLGISSNNWTTVTDMNRGLAAFYGSDLLTQEWRDYLLEKMTAVKPGLNYLTSIGPDVPVSHKNGFFPTSAGWYVDNDIGIVRFERDGEQYAYAVSFFSQHVPNKYDDLPLGQGLSAATWRFFQERYPAPDPAITIDD
ncbi:MAG: hypothetical protein HOH95_08180, partial [Dehalococcoidia bacterium]|nr:hypothetical protein [Dehalococcoidia bacterium]